MEANDESSGLAMQSERKPALCNNRALFTQTDTVSIRIYLSYLISSYSLITVMI